MRILITCIGFFATGLLQAAEPAAQAATPRVTEAVGVGSALQVVLALALVLALIVITGWFFRRFSGVTQGRAGALQLLSGIAVGQRERIVLVQAGEVQLLLGVAPGSVNTLHVFDKPLQLGATTGSKAEGFAERLRSAIDAARGERQ